LNAVQRNDTATNRQALAVNVNREVRFASPVLDQLRALEPPAGDRVVIAQYLGAVASNISLAQRFAGAVENHDAQAVQPVAQQLHDNAVSARALAQGYGFKVCGSGT
jgi:hypothetical protein